MEKIKVTKKAIRANFKKIVKIGYGDMSSLLNYRSPFAYSIRTEGWACDYYEINTICISTGYAPIGENIDYNLLDTYEKKARMIQSDYSIPWEDQAKETDRLLLELLSMI
jgi:hypothetical protein